MAETTPTPHSVLNEFIESIDWTLPLDQLKELITKHITATCKNNYHKVKMANVVAGLDNLEALQRYTFNALLKFENNGVLGLLPR